MRAPPSDNEMEKALLGTLLLDEQVVEEFITNYELEIFYNNQMLAKAIYTLAFEGTHPDMISVKNYLEAKGQLVSVGGMSHLADVTDLASTFLWRQQAEKLTQLYKQRKVLEASRRLEEGAYNEDFENIVETTFSSLSLSLSEGSTKATDVEDNISLMEQQIAITKAGGGNLVGWSWGNDWLDNFTGGLKKGKQYRIGAPSGLGKTNLVYETIVNLIEQGAKVLFISLENTIETTYINLLSSLQKTNSRKIERGEIEPNTEWLRRNKEKLILTDQIFDIQEIKREVVKHKPDVVILDYIGLVSIKGCDEKSLYNTYADEVKRFVQKHKSFAWIDLSNLNKDDDEERIRQHKGFNGSAKLRNNTDFALHMFYYKPFYEYKESFLLSKDNNQSVEQAFYGKQVITFLISKNRGGVDGIEKPFQIDFDKGICYSAVPADKLMSWKF